MRKSILGLLLFVLTTTLSGCDFLLDECYSEDPKLYISKGESIYDYTDYFSSLLNEEALSLGIELEQDIDYSRNYLRIIYTDDEYMVTFSFNDSGGFYSRVHYFNEEIQELFQYELYEKYIEFVANVNERIVHKHQGDVETYRQMYIDYLDHNRDTDYIYFSSSCNSKLGYSIHVSDNYSQDEERWFISFGYHGLLELVE